MPEFRPESSLGGTIRAPGMITWQKDGGRLLIVRVLSTADVCGKQRFPGSLPVRIYRKHGNCWSWPLRSRKVPCHFRPPPPPPPDYSRRWIIVARPENFRVSPESQDTGMQLDSGTMAKSDSAVGKLLENFLDEKVFRRLNVDSDFRSSICIRIGIPVLQRCSLSPSLSLSFSCSGRD